jgi:hypothetical protein
MTLSQPLHKEKKRMPGSICTLTNEFKFIKLTNNTKVDRLSASHGVST